MDAEFPFKVIKMLGNCANEQLCNNTKSHWVNMYTYLGIFSSNYTEKNPILFSPFKMFKMVFKNIFISNFFSLTSFNFFPPKFELWRSREVSLEWVTV